MLQTRFHCELVEIVFATLFQAAPVQKLQRSFRIEFSISFLSEFWCVVVWRNHNGSESERFQKSRGSEQRAYHTGNTRCHWLFWKQKIQISEEQKYIEMSELRVPIANPFKPGWVHQKKHAKKIRYARRTKSSECANIWSRKKWILDQKRILLD